MLALLDAHGQAPRPRGDIDQILFANIAKRVPLERGVVGPTGASSIINASLLGPPFALYGGVQGTRIIAAAGTARAYLEKVLVETDALAAKLERLRDLAAEQGVPHTLAHLTRRVAALAAFRRDVARAAREQRFNQLVPGGIQMGASASVLTVGINGAPGLAHGTTLLGVAGTVALGALAGGALCVYGGLSLARSAAMALGAWRLPKRDVALAQSPREKAFLLAYNKRLGIQRLFHSLNAVSWAGFVAGCGCLIGIAAGAALSHGAAVAAVILTSLGVVVWDRFWGERCAPKNALTPHVDRNQVVSLAARARVWSLLKKQGAAKKSLRRALSAATLPTGQAGRDLGALAERARAHLPLVGGDRHLAREVAKAPSTATRSAVAAYLTRHMELEVGFLANKLRQHEADSAARRSELEALRQSPRPSEIRDAFRDLAGHDEALSQSLGAQLRAARALFDDLVDLDRASGGPTDPRAFDRVLARFVVVNEMENEVFSGRDIEKAPKSFAAMMRPRTWYAKARPVHIRLTEQGLEKIEAEGLSLTQRTRLVRALLSAARCQYEEDALFNMETHSEQTA